MRSPAMIACGLSLAHRAKYGMKKKPFSSIKVLTGNGVFGITKQDMGVPSSAQQGSGLKKDPGPDMLPTKRALKFRF